MIHESANTITFEQLVGRLERAIHYDCGLRGLMILLYGWRMHPAYRKKPSSALLQVRKAETGGYYLTHEETLSFSKYCGYDLRQPW